MTGIRSVGGDVRFALRSFVRRPVGSLVIVLSAALGITTNTILFSLANAIFLKPLGVKDPRSLVNVYATERGQGSFLLSYPEFQDLRQQPVFDEVVAHALASFVLAADGETFEVTGEIVSDGYFSALGIAALRGRTLEDLDAGSMPGGPSVVIDHQLWQLVFEQADVLGSHITLNAHDFTIIGITPQEFSGTFPGVRSALWIHVDNYDRVMPVSDTLASRRSRRFDVTARLTPIASVRSAQASVSALATAQSAVNQIGQEDRGYLVAPANGIRPGIRGVVRVFLSGLWVVVALVLFAACANITGILLVQTSERERELAIRRALGATRFRMGRMLITESILLALAGGMTAITLTAMISRVLQTWRPDVGMPIFFDVMPDWRVGSFAILVALAASLLFGLTPAVYSTRGDVTLAFRAHSHSRSSSRLRNLFVTLQIAVSLALLASAGLVLTSMRTAINGDPGFDVSRVTVGTIDLDLLGYEAHDGYAVYDEILRALHVTPGVESVAIARYVPLASQSSRYDIRVGGEVSNVYYNVVSPEYFATLGIRVVQGREFTERDRMAARRVSIVNQAFAHDYFGTDAVVGQRFRLIDGLGEESELDIVGVTDNIKHRSVTESARPYLYLPHGQHYRGLMTIHLRAEAGATPAVTDLIRQTRRVEPLASITNTGPMREMMRYVQFSQRLSSVVLVVAGTIALLLAAVGLYTVVAYAVSRRTKEIGVRLALGARRHDVLRMIVLEGARLILAGSLVGALVSWGLGKLLQTLIVNVDVVQPGVYLTASMVLTSVGLLAILSPANRAARMEPVKALRTD